MTRHNLSCWPFPRLTNLHLTILGVLSEERGGEGGGHEASTYLHSNFTPFVTAQFTHYPAVLVYTVTGKPWHNPGFPESFVRLHRWDSTQNYRVFRGHNTSRKLRLPRQFLKKKKQWRHFFVKYVTFVLLNYSGLRLLNFVHTFLKITDTGSKPWSQWMTPCGGYAPNC